MDQYLGEIRLFAGGFAPTGWLFCDGSLQSIANNTALYALLGTAWGGDGVSTFGIPDLRNKLPVGQGQGLGLSNRILGQYAGSAGVTLLDSNMPHHNHTFSVSTAPATSTTLSANEGFASPTGNIGTGSFVDYAAPTATPAPATVVLAGQALTPYPGGSQPHSNEMPSLSINFIIATTGVFPSRN